MTQPNSILLKPPELRLSISRCSKPRENTPKKHFFKILWKERKKERKKKKKKKKKETKLTILQCTGVTK